MNQHGNMVYYLSWEEDDWLDEILDFFPSVNALVPTVKTVEQIRKQLEEGIVERALFIVNVGEQGDKTGEIVRLLASDSAFSRFPLYLVGLNETEAEKWKSVVPQAKTVVITGFAVEFDYEAVLREMKADWGVAD